MGRLGRLPPHPWLGCASILVDFIGLGMIAPILPGIVPHQSVGNILTAQYLAVVVGQVAVAALSDCIGRRKVIVLVMALDALLFGATGFTTDATTLVVLRLLAGLAAPVALGISYVATVSLGLSTAEAQLNFACVGISFSLGTLIGAATGGLLSADHWLPANLVTGAIPCFVALAALLTRDAAGDSTEEQRAPSPENAKTGLAQLLRMPEMASVLLGYVANGFFQGSFFSLMPVLLHDAVIGSALDPAPFTSGVIMAAAALQIAANVCCAPALLRLCGAHAFSAATNLACALLLAALVLLEHVARSPLSPFLIGTLFVLAYVPSACSLDVLNQAGAIYAQLHRAPLGVSAALGRCLFASAFGIAPAASIKLYEVAGGAAGLPLAVMAALCTCVAAAFSCLKMKRAGGDAIPPAASTNAQASSSPAGAV